MPFEGAKQLATGASQSFTVWSSLPLASIPPCGIKHDP